MTTTRRLTRPRRPLPRVRGHQLMQPPHTLQCLDAFHTPTTSPLPTVAPAITPLPCSCTPGGPDSTTAGPAVDPATPVAPTVPPTVDRIPSATSSADSGGVPLPDPEPDRTLRPASSASCPAYLGVRVTSNHVSPHAGTHCFTLALGPRNASLRHPAQASCDPPQICEV